MSERGIVDATRQGEGNAAPKQFKGPPPPMSVEEALEYDRRFRWRGYPSSGDRARQALADEVARLRGVISELEHVHVNASELVATYHGRLEHACQTMADEVARLRLAASDVIGCAHGEAETCTRDPCGYGMCCAIRNRMVRAGLLPRPPRREEPEDGA